MHGRKVRPSKRKLTNRQAGRQARVVRNGRTGPALLACLLIPGGALACDGQSCLECGREN